MISLPPVRFLDVLDVLLVAVVVHRVISLVRGTRAVQVLLGLSVLLAAYGIARAAGLLAFQWVMEQFLGSIIVVLAVIFQAEIRRGLAKVGQAGRFGAKSPAPGTGWVRALARASFALSGARTGAIVVIEREMGLNELAEGGREVDGRFSPELLLTLFAPSSPLHDGAVILREGRIARAGVILPLPAESPRHAAAGTRHRAACGISAESDAVALAVSEETGKVTVFHDGEGTVLAGEEELARHLSSILGDGGPDGAPS